MCLSILPSSTTNLRVDAQRPTTGIGEHDGVVNGEGVVWEACNDPAAHTHRLCQRDREGVLLGDGDANLVSKGGIAVSCFSLFIK